ncbi:MAG TPA: acetylglutamate kinase [Bacillaceae bacterium]
MTGIIVIKCGGSMIDSLDQDFYEGIKKLQEDGFRPVIVHGGGPAINQLLETLEIESEFIDGLRKTTKDVLHTAEMVLSGSMANRLVRGLQKYGMPSISVTGFDGQCIQAEAMDPERLGFVGRITGVDSGFLNNLISMGLIPVISPLAAGVDGEEFYNINADTAAGAVASSLKAEKLLFVTDVPGVLHKGSLIQHATYDEIMRYIQDGTITGGMIPKVKAALECLDDGMEETMIVGGNSPFYKDSAIIGTAIRKEREAVC